MKFLITSDVNSGSTFIKSPPNSFKKFAYLIMIKITFSDNGIINLI